MVELFYSTKSSRNELSRSSRVKLSDSSSESMSPDHFPSLPPSNRPSASNVWISSPQLGTDSTLVLQSATILPGRASVEVERRAVQPGDSPRTYHDKMRAFTGIGSESYRSAFGLPEDRGIAWEMHCMRERVLATSRDPTSIVRVPELVQHKYHSLLLLNAPDSTEYSHVKQSRTLGYRTCAYKALSTVDPFVYCLRRVDGFRLSNFDLVQEAIERWSDIKHPNIVSVRQAFATSEFQDVEGNGEGGSLVYVYDYIDLAQTLEGWHDATGNKAVQETVLWDVITQILLALRLIHSRKLAVRCLHPAKILVSSRFRIHLNCVGLLDAIQHHSLWSDSETIGGKDALQEHQRRDLHGFARVILCLSLGKRWEDTSGVLFSRETNGDPGSRHGLSQSVQRLIEELMSSEGSAESATALIGSFIAFKAEQLESTQDVLVSELRKFIDVSRMQKLLVKLCAISDRPHLLDDWRWASTGDRYIVQLFRDYIFYQNDEAGRPFLDYGHVSDCLAKVDVGSFEPIMLMNRDGSSVIVTTYNDIRRCIEVSFKELSEASMMRPSHRQQVA
jgi:PAB-dependent poly(A)-specific ribonuclease subunit 3